ncbi:NMDA receptor synaptonuclear signaling and neuronal migration factor-like [Branchiostoma floridae x Branchiostoma japonicum]
MFTQECGISPDLHDLESLPVPSPRDNKTEEQAPVQNKISTRLRHHRTSSKTTSTTSQGKGREKTTQRHVHYFHKLGSIPCPSNVTITDSLCPPRHLSPSCTADELVDEPCDLVKDLITPLRRYPYCEVCCGNGTDSLASLQQRKERREHREQPWTEDTPEYEDLQWKIVNELQLNIDNYKGDIVDLRWKAEQIQERADLAAHGALPPPRVVLISSSVPKAKFLPLTVKSDPAVLVVSYDHQNDSFDKILGAVQSKLIGYCPGCKAKSLLLYIKGGPAHLYLKKNKVTTVAKLKKEGSEDMVWFWKTLGSLMSKLEPDSTVIHIMGCNVMGYPKYVGIDLFEYLQELMKPSIVKFEAPLEVSIKGNAIIGSYFDRNKYKLWKSQKNSNNLEKVFGLRSSTSTPRATSRVAMVPTSTSCGRRTDTSS